MHRSFLVVRSLNASDATVRLQTDPILRGLRNHPAISVQRIDATQPFNIPNGSCVLFHFADHPAIAALKRARTRNSNFIAASFGSDIYRLARYVPADEVTDLHIMPAEIHRQVLATQFYKPVYFLPEAIDPIAKTTQASAPVFATKTSTRLLWFGYHERLGSRRIDEKRAAITRIHHGINLPNQFLRQHDMCSLRSHRYSPFLL